MVSEQDFERLSAYIDDELSPAERAALEQRLREDRELRQELQELRLIVTALQGMQSAARRRDFKLTEAMAASVKRTPRFLVFPATTTFTALSTAAALILTFLGVFLLLAGQSVPEAAAPLNAVGGVAAAPTVTMTAARDRSDIAATSEMVPPSEIAASEPEAPPAILEDTGDDTDVSSGQGLFREGDIISPADTLPGGDMADDMDDTVDAVAADAIAEVAVEEESAEMAEAEAAFDAESLDEADGGGAGMPAPAAPAQTGGQGADAAGDANFADPDGAGAETGDVLRAVPADRQENQVIEATILPTATSVPPTATAAPSPTTPAPTATAAAIAQAPDSNAQDEQIPVLPSGADGLSARVVGAVLLISFGVLALVVAFGSAIQRRRHRGGT